MCRIIAVLAAFRCLGLLLTNFWGLGSEDSCSLGCAQRRAMFGNTAKRRSLQSDVQIPKRQ